MTIKLNMLKQSCRELIVLIISFQIYGAVQQESRVSKVIDVMLLHVENLKRIYEKDHAELEETKLVHFSCFLLA